MCTKVLQNIIIQVKKKFDLDNFSFLKHVRFKRSEKVIINFRLKSVFCYVWTSFIN